jgi:hypothetical protein
MEKKNLAMGDEPVRELRRRLVESLEGGHAHMTFDEAVADFPMDRINDKAPNMPYSPWHTLEHLRIALWDIVEFIRNPEHVSPVWPEGYFPSPGEKADSRRWDKTVRDIRSDLDRLKNFAANSGNDLFSPIPHAKDYTIYREILTAADHTAYHIGEFAVLRQVMGTWPPDGVLYDAV